jgi:threonine/homoserine/homoserine lactone efflux protein
MVDREEAARSDAAHQSFLKATAVALLNPNPYISWSTVMGPIVLRAWAEAPGLAIAFVAGFYIAMVGLNATIIILFARAGDLGPKVARTVLGVAAVALALLGLYQLWTGISQFTQPAG